MARIETVVCDGCGASITREQAHVKMDISGNRLNRATADPYDEIARQMRELFKDQPKDFCDFLCVQRWIEKLGPSLLS